MTATLGDWTNLGIAFGNARRRAGLTQAELAERVGLDRRSIGNYESGEMPKSAPRVPPGYYKAAEGLGMSVADVERLLLGPVDAAPVAAGNLATRMTASHITHLADRLTADAEGLAEDLQRFAARAGQGKFLGDEVRNLTEHMARLTWQASRLDGMREMAEIYATEQPAAVDGA